MQLLSTIAMVLAFGYLAFTAPLPPFQGIQGVNAKQAKRDLNPVPSALQHFSGQHKDNPRDNNPPLSTTVVADVDVSLNNLLDRLPETKNEAVPPNNNRRDGDTRTFAYNNGPITIYDPDKRTISVLGSFTHVQDRGFVEARDDSTGSGSKLQDRNPHSEPNLFPGSKRCDEDLPGRLVKTRSSPSPTRLHDAAHCILFFIPQGSNHPEDTFHFHKKCRELLQSGGSNGNDRARPFSSPQSDVLAYIAKAYENAKGGGGPGLNFRSASTLVPEDGVVLQRSFSAGTSSPQVQDILPPDVSGLISGLSGDAATGGKQSGLLGGILIPGIL